MFKITFLGTGTSQGIPIIGCKHPVCLSKNPKDKRLRVSILISWKSFNYVIDCGPDFRQQLLKNPIPNLNGILFTHEHADHTAGLDDIRPFFFRQGKIKFIANQEVFDALDKRFSYIMNDQNKYPGAPSVLRTVIDYKHDFTLEKLKITPIKIMHYQLEVMGYRFGNFAYLTDVKTIEDEEFEKLNSLDVLVLSALRIEPHPSHLNLEEALAMVERIQPKKTYFTHISHLLGFHDEVEANLPKNVHLAFDNLQITSS
ncbi:MAG: MBL fold metallo-hydrolase [Flavobacteriales bacterium]|nr:MBL fold metallo-hydrolase [Candidatus Arcticimaribacter sp.]|tara:strand:+ start:491 stop:1261 length:771 start_codon:yes stop_codon:yes gene_type:complete